jgi:hypothetical protein
MQKTAEEIQALAQQYLRKEQMSSLIFDVENA